MDPSISPGEFRICGVRIHAMQLDNALAIVQHWMESDRVFHSVFSTNVNNVAIALESPEYFEAMEQADISLPDGVPFLWYGRLKGFPLRMPCGIEELMPAVFETSNQGGAYSHFFYGSTPEVLGRLKTRLLKRYPNLNIAGMHAPPFRPLTPQEDDEDIKMINDSGADFLWVSLGCPKQEQWLHDHRERLTVVLAGGAGAVFNSLSGEISQTPQWLRRMGLGWLLRLLMEPKRLFPRYCIRYPMFVLQFIKHEIGIKSAKRAKAAVPPQAPE